MTTMTLNEARRIWEVMAADKGGHCPCCDRFGKVYSTQISAVMAKSLLWMASKHGEEWVNMPEKAPRWITRSNSFNKLKNWGLVSPMPVDQTDKTKSSGFWRVTAIGMKFAKGETKMPKYAFTYNDSVLKLSDETIHIQDCFGKKFNYAEVMQEAWKKGY
jgi:hypothetical protein